MKGAKGLTKSWLEPDGVRAETVTQIALWRYHEQFGYDTIAERLNADLTTYSPPSPPGGRRPAAVGCVEQVQRLGRAEEPQVHRLPGVQPARDPLPEREGQRPGQVGVVTRTDTPAADPEVDVRRTYFPPRR
jgi:hypothetical protein